ncbi:MAG TPA: TIGR00730 family Rossman fold protein [Ferruginibacter sp.]|nr:TIGR00730 family Rossman fold protein [Ferruginibacter sp.]HNN69710.1 TIGR00730 family Rossman fold protein [Ferruginibacter sp.]
MQVKALAVFCGSKSGNNPLYEAQATELGHLLAEKNITLIYGGGNKGIMGAVSNATLAKNGRVTGIIPSILKDREVHHEGITELIIVENMHIRKKMLYEKCDAAIILPGGFGTMDEFFEMVTWNQLSIHDKKIFILNTAGFYDHLLALARTMQQEGFLYDRIEDRLVVLESVTSLRQYLE